MPASGHDLGANRLSRAAQPPARHRRLVIPGAAAEEVYAAHADAYFGMMAQADKSVFGCWPTAAPARALGGLGYLGPGLDAHGGSRLQLRLQTLTSLRQAAPAKTLLQPCFSSFDHPRRRSGVSSRPMGCRAGRSRFYPIGAEQLVDHRFDQTGELLLAPGGRVKRGLGVKAVGIGHRVDR